MADQISFKVLAGPGRVFDESYAVRVVGTEPTLNGTPSRVLAARVVDGGQALELTIEAVVPEAVYEDVEHLSVERPHVHPGLGRQGGLAFASRRFPGGR